MKSWIPSPRLGAADPGGDFLCRAVGETEPPETLSEFLGALRSLREVPFYYLVPDARLLPEESLRLAYLDENWTDALCDGLLSIGRCGAPEREHDRLFKLHAAPAARRCCRAARMRRLALAVPDALPPAAHSAFLLRSRLVSAYPGLEVSGRAGNTGLPLLRLERLAPDILFGLFDGAIDTLVLNEPRECIHFGLGEDGGVLLHNLDPARGVIGALVPDGSGQPLSAPCVYRKGAPAVLDVCATAESIRSQLEKHGALGQWFTSAELAVELLAAPCRLEVAITDGKRSKKRKEEEAGG